MLDSLVAAVGSMGMVGVVVCQVLSARHRHRHDYMRMRARNATSTADPRSAPLEYSAEHFRMVGPTRLGVATIPRIRHWVPGPRALRAWALASGEPDGAHYLLYLDPHAPESAPVLATALMRAGVAPTLVGTRGNRPALRVSGHRRLLRLRESIGDPPLGPAAAAAWPVP
ncbi:hypothetical protein [Tsukamurella paurometabola]|uniref:hypothetical protein n=1 Tax=Tsukamurella paurometabola TaxID=2061 RepID=UPI003CCA7C68